MRTTFYDSHDALRMTFADTALAASDWWKICFVQKPIDN